MNSINLLLPDHTASKVFACGKCRFVSNDQAAAERCCAPVICSCGATIEEKHYTTCLTCRNAKSDAESAARELKQFNAAEKLSLSDYDGPFFHDSGPNDGYTETEDEMLEHFRQDIGTPPDYLWACHIHPICLLDYDSIIENATQEAYDGWDADSLTGEGDLKAAIDRFNDLNRGHVYWTPDFERAVLIPEKLRIPFCPECGEDMLIHDEHTYRCPANCGNFDKHTLELTGMTTLTD